MSFGPGLKIMIILLVMSVFITMIGQEGNFYEVQSSEMQEISNLTGVGTKEVGNDTVVSTADTDDTFDLSEDSGFMSGDIPFVSDIWMVITFIKDVLLNMVFAPLTISRALELPTIGQYLFGGVWYFALLASIGSFIRGAKL